ncbi:GIN domain-containing protein [Psychroflexus planctonicus]|uniref:Putative auto-transporter adhesin head GIN domain-containing protein n=1 Tax=Psychroflexus planctonicus TaxID=1526575 RepID=A0ABQ1SHL2_9FLAO|nr:DUF2807 domain-containing protein [Psychroflexus planctonicus]GGE39865.1 hypothetical protein GCM10010832_20080 [Psychroflexus planctonicus]
MSSILKLVFALCVSISMTKCGYVTNSVDGKGEVIQQEYELSTFTSIKLKNGWEVELIPSEDNKMLISANENLFEELQYEVDEETLIIEADSNIGNADKKLIQLFYNQALVKISASSGVYLHTASPIETNKLNGEFSSGCKAELILNTEALSVSASSGANVILSGNSKSISYSASSGAGITAVDLVGNGVSASASSGSSIKLTVNGNLNASSSSGAVIKYQGDVQSLKKSSSSGGSVKEI